MATPLPPAKALPVLRATFVSVEEKLIECIINHQLLARDLYKLRPQSTSKEDLREASLYKNPGAVIHPLHVYFAILSEYLTYSAINLVFFRYLNHLRDLINVYEWPTVLEYHESYFNHRVFDMRTWGDYGSWGLPDWKLMNQLGFTHHCTSTPEITVPSQQLKVVGYREELLLPITFIVRRIMDPFGDRHAIPGWTKELAIYEHFSLFNDLPSPFRENYFYLHFGIFDGTNLIKDKSERSEFPVEEVIKLLSYEAGKIPFLNIVAKQDFDSSKKDAKKRIKVQAQAK